MSNDASAGEREVKHAGTGEPTGERTLLQDGGQKTSTDKPRRLEATFKALASQRRRYVVYELQATGRLDLETLSTAITAMERGVSRNAVTATERDRTKTHLIHADLPLLEEAGVVTYDEHHGEVRYVNPPSYLDPVLRLCADVDAPIDRRN